jgi:hypothetical protein
VGIYVGGVNRACDQPELTAPWVVTASAQGWRLIPIYVGLQPVCSVDTRAHPFAAKAATALTQGSQSADDAVAQMSTLGLRSGSAVYFDLENYAVNDAKCAKSVLSFLSGWTKELHAKGYLAGVYANQSSGAQDIGKSYSSPDYARPDAIWIARWDKAQALKGWKGLSDTSWAVHQRAKQYAGAHDETYGGVTLNIDSNAWDAPVGTVPLIYRVIKPGTAATWSLPSSHAPSMPTGRREPGAKVEVICQTPGPSVGKSTVWNMLSDGTFIADAYLSTPGTTGYTQAIPRCTGADQGPGSSTVVKHATPHAGAAGGLAERARALRPGAVAWVYCQTSGRLGGTAGGKTKIWNRFVTANRYISDLFVVTPSPKREATTIPRCG